MLYVGDTAQEGWEPALRDEDVEMFKSPAEIQAMRDDLDLSQDQKVITYCQTLWRGVHTYFLLRLWDSTMCVAMTGHGSNGAIARICRWQPGNCQVNSNTINDKLPYNGYKIRSLKNE